MDHLLLLLLLLASRRRSIIKLHALIVVALAGVANLPIIIIDIVVSAYLGDFLHCVVLFELRCHSRCVCGGLLLCSPVVSISFLVLLGVARVACGGRSRLRALPSNLLLATSLPILTHHLLVDGGKGSIFGRRHRIVRFQISREVSFVDFGDIAADAVVGLIGRLLCIHCSHSDSLI